MSGNKHSGNAKQHNSKGIAKQSGSKDKPEKTKEEHVKSETKCEDHNCVKCHPQEVVVNIPPQQDRWTIGNVIALGAGIATVAYFIATVSILHATNKAANMSDSTFQEVKREFVLSNRPMLFMSNLRIDTLKLGRKNTYTIYFNNYGKMPIYIDSIKAGMAYSNKPSLDTFIYEPDNIREVNMFIPTNDSLRWPAYIIPFDSSALEFIKTLKIFPFIYGEIYYYDLTNKQRGKYEYCFRFFWDGRFIPTQNHNGIIEGKDSLMLR